MINVGVCENDAANRRSEEHTSELQSPCNLVCRLLLEKKKNIHVRVNRLFDVCIHLSDLLSSVQSCSLSVIRDSADSGASLYLTVLRLSVSCLHKCMH